MKEIDWGVNKSDIDEDGFIVLKCIDSKLEAKFPRRDLTTYEIVFRHGHIAIRNYHIGDNRAMEKALSVWDKMYFRYNLIGGYYVKDLKEFRINRGFDTKLLQEFFPDLPVRVENKAFIYDKIDIDLMVAPRDDFQKAALTFMAGQDVYWYNSKYTQQIINSPPGSGKTYAGCAITAYLKEKALVIIPIGALLSQWKQSFIDFTSLDEDDIMIVQGSKACQKIIAGECRNKKVFIMMVDTIASYAKQFGDLATIEMLAATHAGIKIVDEVHKDMKTIAMIEALSNFHMNYYMSASPDRSESKESWMFKALFRNTPKFGGKFKTQEEKHLNIMIKRYRWTPDSMQIRNMVNPKTGLNTKAYERELINSNDFQRRDFEFAFRTMLNWSKGSVKKENKIMILAQSIDTLYYLQKIVEEVFPGESAIYYGGMKKKDKEAALKWRVIIATSSSLGTGADIKGLQHVYNVATYANKIDAIQISGRCRKLPDNTPVVYCELVNFGYRKTVNQFERRKPYLINQTRTGKLIVVN